MVYIKIESVFQREVLSYLNKKRVWHFRYNASAQLNGLPDIICLYKGFFIGLELKADKGSPTQLQLKKIEVINENGGIGLIVTNIKQVENLLNDINNGVYNEKKSKILW